MSNQHERYPLYMTHPNYWPGSIGEEQTDKSGFKFHAGGLPSRFPPVQVHTEDQESQYAAKGYVPAGKSDPTAFIRLTAMAGAATDYTPEEYPKWVGPVLVNSAEEEAALTGQTPVISAAPQPGPAAAPQEGGETAQPVTDDPAAETMEAKIARLERELAEARTAKAPAPAAAPKAKPKPSARPTPAPRSKRDAGPPRQVQPVAPAEAAGPPARRRVVDG